MSLSGLNKSTPNLTHSSSKSSVMPRRFSSDAIPATTPTNPSANKIKEFISQLGLTPLPPHAIEKEIQIFQNAKKYASLTPEAAKPQLEIQQLKAINNILYSFYSPNSSSAATPEASTHLQDELEKYKSNFEKLRQAFQITSDQNRKIQDERSKETAVSNSRLATLTETNNRLSTETKNLALKNEVLNKEINALKAQLASTPTGKVSALVELKAKNIQETQQKLLNCEREVSKLKGLLSSKETELAQKTKEFSSQNRQLKEQVETLQKEVDSLNQKISAAQKKQMASEKEAARQKMAMSKAQEEVQKQDQWIAELKTKQDKVVNQLTEAREELLQLQNIRAQELELRASIAELEQIVTGLQKELEESRAEKNRAQAILQRAKEAFHIMQTAFMPDTRSGVSVIDLSVNERSPTPALSTTSEPIEDQREKRIPSKRSLEKSGETELPQKKKRVRRRDLNPDCLKSYNPDPAADEAESAGKPINALDSLVNAADDEEFEYDRSQTTQTRSSTRRTSSRLQAAREEQQLISQRPRRSAKATAASNMNKSREKDFEQLDEEIEELKERETQYRKQHEKDQVEIESLRKQLAEARSKS